ncbi:restriction endonuclease subunit S [Synechococcus sp. CBW1004]|uniref:restriction endonuclease subunit S n=1 Tax=Synechococcus sp. CBW1004 TaxID=1353136 RepID=UPI0018CF12C6|nr:restriction endonuclease subunit S [Synechococcus sp. CBW1004]QPN64621.1 restriction endonuclease subunit S [Synechococcus sp. CBW1004]
MSFPRYTACKDSGVEWLGKVPEYWEGLRLRFAATLNPSKQEARSYADDDLVTFLPMEAIGEDGSLNLEQVKEVGECLNGYTYFKEGDVCIAKITPCFENGKGAILRGLKGGIGFGTTELIVARPTTHLLLAKFLDYLFRSNPFRSLGEAAMYGAGGQKRVPEAFVRDFRSFIPPLTEQQQIISFLDCETAKIDALIAEQQRLIELLQEKRQTVISHAVTKGLNPDAPMKDSGVEWLGEVPEHWRVRKLSQLCKEIGSGTTPKSDMPEFYEDGAVPWVVTGDLNDSVLVACSNHVTEAAVHQHSALKLHVVGSVVVAMYGATIGKAAILGVEATVNQACCVLPPGTEIIGEFLLLFILAARSHLLSLATGGGQPNINQEIVRSLRLPLPPLAEQHAIVQKVEASLQSLDSAASLGLPE